MGYLSTPSEATVVTNSDLIIMECGALIYKVTFSKLERVIAISAGKPI